MSQSYPAPAGAIPKATVLARLNGDERLRLLVLICRALAEGHKPKRHSRDLGKMLDRWLDQGAIRRVSYDHSRHVCP